MLEDLMKVADLMRKPVRSILPEATVEEALVTLADYPISALPVVDAKGRAPAAYGRH